MNYFNLANFANFGFGAYCKTSMAIENKLRDPNTSLEDLLQEDEIVQELRRKNQNLLAFLTKERVKELVNYIINEPYEDDFFKGYKFPFMASELLCSEEAKILKYFDEADDYFREGNRKASYMSVPERYRTDIQAMLKNKLKEQEYEDDQDDDYDSNDENNDTRSLHEGDKPRLKTNRIELLDHLLNFLLTDKELNYVLAGYFSLLLNLLISKKPFNVISYIFIQREELLERFIYHSYRKSISDVLSRMLLFEFFEENRDRYGYSGTDLLNLDNHIFDMEILGPKRLKMIELAIKMINIAEKNNDHFENLIAFLIEVVEKNKALIRAIVSDNNILTILLEPCKYDTNQYDSFETRVNYAQYIMLIHKIINNCLADITLLPNEGETILSKRLIEVIPFLINNFSMTSQTSTKSIDSTFNIPYSPLGSHRVKIVELVALLFQYFKSFPQIYDTLLINSTFFPNALDYLFKYEWNNLYQLALSLLFKNYLNEAKQHKELSEYLCNKLNLLQLIIERLSDGKFLFRSHNIINHGYNSFLISLSYKINTIGGGDTLIIPNQTRKGSICFVNKTNMTDIITNIAQLSKAQKVEPSSVDICDSWKGYLNESWNTFFQTEVENMVKLYEGRLCDISKESLNEAIKSEDNKEELLANNPFLSKDTNSSPKNNDNENYNLNDFNFLEKDKLNPMNNEGDGNEIKVDELDPNYFSNNQYWKDSLFTTNKDALEEELKELLNN